MIDPIYANFETKSIIVLQIIVACWIPNNNKIPLTGSIGFDKTDSSRFGL
jgi:hypothetical protein